MPDPNWQSLYNAALSEADPLKLGGRIEVARRAIRDRISQLAEFENVREREQLERALHALFTLQARRRSA